MDRTFMHVLIVS